MPLAATPSPFRRLWQLALQRLGRHGSAATIYRLATSRHVADLRFVCGTTVCFVLATWLFAYVFEFWQKSWQASKAASNAAATSDSLVHFVLHWLWIVTDSLVASFPLVGAVFALGCGITAWAYQSGSARLGIVDLFACEIATLCRVCTIVDVAQRYVRAFNADLDTRGPPDPATVARIRRAFSHFAATENYTPVFDQNASALQVLDAKVVINVTAFYTYMKAMRDSLRTLANTDAPGTNASAHDAWHEGLANVIYMQFLAFESARKAVRDLVEFEPNEVEITITILVSELCAYTFLLDQFGAAQQETGAEDFRHARLRLRREGYRATVARAYWRAQDGDRYWSQRAADAGALMSQPPQANPQSEPQSEPEAAWHERRKAAMIVDLAREWRKAAETANELENRYQLLFPGERIERPAHLGEPTDPLDAR
jgi:hypothetical protein